MNLTRYASEWSRHPVQETLAGMVGTFALIPEVIAFTFVAGVDPEVGLYASFVISVAVALFGGRPAMISGAAGSVALVAAALVHTHGLPYLLAATVLTGVLQVGFAAARLHVLMGYVSQSVRTGFVNALAILIFSAQVPQLLSASWHTYAMVALGLLIIYLAPRVTKAIPSPLICVVVLTVAAALVPMPLRTVADLGRLPSDLPRIHPLQVPFTWETLRVIAPYALAMSVVGVLESLMTAGVVDNLTETHSSKRQETFGLGVANGLAGLFGGIAGCGMIGQTVGNVKYGGRGRLSTLVAGLFLLLLIVVLRPWIARVPVAALVAIMIMVSISTFSWRSLRNVIEHPKLTSAVMLSTVVCTVLTRNLALGVSAGVVLSALFFAFKVSSLLQVSMFTNEADLLCTYVVRGQVFFASAQQLIDAFEFQEHRGLLIDLRQASLWDITSREALDTVIGRFQRHGVAVQVIGLDEATKFVVGAQAADPPK